MSEHPLSDKSVNRRPLTEAQRQGLTARYDAEDYSMICNYYEGCVIGCSADAADGKVTIDTWGCGEHRQSTCWLSPDEARREATALLQAADWAEFGPGEWSKQSYGEVADHETPALSWRSTVAEDGQRA